jgi:hypothetical protein
VGQNAFFNDPGSEPLPDQPHDSPIIDPFPQYVSQSGLVYAVKISTDICIHDPADPLRHAPFAYLVECVMGTAALSKAVRAVAEILLVDRFQQHHHRSLNDFIFEGRLPDRSLFPVVLFELDAFDWRRLIASASQALVQVTQVLVEVFGILLRRHPIDPWGARLARLAIRLSQKVSVHQVGQRRKDAGGIAGGLRRNLLEFWCDGW